VSQEIVLVRREDPPGPKGPPGAMVLVVSMIN